MFRSKNKNMVISYLTLRQLIGVLGILLPFVCVVGGFLTARDSIQSSISAYYYTNMRDFFCGLLILVGVFLITYYGYETVDKIINTLTGVAGIGIAFFPCSSSSDSISTIGIFLLSPQVSNVIHTVCAAAFFILLAANSLFLFTMSSKKSALSPMKIIRNKVYISCGLIIFLSLIGLVVLMLLLPISFIHQWRLILILETIMLCAFGLSWLVKGEVLFKDR